MERVIQLPVGRMANFTYLVYDDESDSAAIIDPSWDLERVLDALKKNGLKPLYIINTHSHFDHVLGNEQMAKITGAKIIQHKNSPLSKDIACDDSDVISIGNSKLRVVHTPGHSEDSVCLVCEGKFVLTGDTLFVGNCGRTDLPGSNASELYHSLFDKLSSLDDSLVVYPGHDYGSTPSSTIGNEKKTNFVLKPRTQKEFVAFMSHGD